MAALAVPESGDYVYPGEGSGFIVLDASDPSQIRQGASLPFGDGGDVGGVTRLGSAAYLANATDLQTVDIAAPLHLTLVGLYETTGSANDVNSVDAAA